MKLLRKRYIPNEEIDISKDEVLYIDKNLIITKWLPINKRDDIGSGISYAFLNEGYKISKFFDAYGNFIYWYCDVIDYEYDEKEDTHKFIDLLVDVKVFPDNKYEILDMDELVDAYKSEIITADKMLKALQNLDKLLKMINGNNFPPETCKKF